MAVFAIVAASTDPSQHHPPVFLQKGEGPLRDFDLLAIGTVLVAVLIVHFLRRIMRKR